jgi:thioredoxin reductase (NADPH)
MNHIDCEALVVGGGPAGLSAALYMARFDRQVLLFDTGQGRSSWHQTNYNYLGFVGGIKARDIRKNGYLQIADYSQIRVVRQAIESMEKCGDGFIARGGEDEWRGRAVILCTGVDDHWPRFPGWQEYVGRSMFWCITCDGYSSRGMRIVAVGHTEEAAITALQLQRFAPDVTLLTNNPNIQIRDQILKRLESAGIPLIHDEIESVEGSDGQFERLITKGGKQIELDRLFSLTGASPRVKLAEDLGVELHENNYIQVDNEQKTNIPGVYAAGDVTCLHSHQIATAVHEGAQAACAANYFLYPPELQYPD